MANQMTGSKSAGQTFVQGATMIAAAHLLVKAIGACFKIPLELMILGKEGMGIYNSAYTIYNWLFMISTAGLPVAVSKMVSESVSLGNTAEAKKIFSISKRLLFLVGAAGSAVLFFGAAPFANALAAPSAKYAIMAMAPSLFFVAVMSAYRGYFQGQNNMAPTAISEVIESLGKLVAGLALGFACVGYGLQFGAAGAIGGVTVGTAFGLLFLLTYTAGTRRKSEIHTAHSRGSVRSTLKLLRQLIYIAIPITLGVSVFTLTSLIDTAMVMNQLQGLGYDEAQRLTMTGYLGHAVTMFNVPPTIIAAIAVSIVPTVAAALAVGNRRLAVENTKSALRITILLALPCAVGLCVLASPILQLVYKDANYSFLLNVMGLAVALVTLVQVGNAILQANGKVWVPVINMAIGGIVKIIVNLVLVSRPEININGAPIGTFLCYFTVMALNLRAIKRITGITYEFSDFILRPLVSVLVMGMATLVTYDFANNFFHHYILAMALAIAVAIVVYLSMMFLVRGVRREDILLLPKGKQFYALLCKLHLMN